MDTVVLQIPLSAQLRRSAGAVAKDYGFSSLQEIVRVLLAKLARRELAVNIEAVRPLSSRNEKRYLAMDKDFAKKRNVFMAKNVDELMGQLKE